MATRRETPPSIGIKEGSGGRGVARSALKAEETNITPRVKNVLLFMCLELGACSLCICKYITYK